MTVHDVLDDDGRLVAFEVDNFQFGRKAAVRVVRDLARVTAVSESRDDEFCTFELDGVKFAIEEPDGNSSRYAVSPVPPRHVETLALVRAAFARARSPR